MKLIDFTPRTPWLIDFSRFIYEFQLQPTRVALWNSG